MVAYKYKLKIKAARSNNEDDAGFTLIEVILAAIILMAFVAISAQSILLSNLVRIKAQERAKANQAIQEDVELLRLIGANDTNVTQLINPNANICAANSNTTGYANSLQTNFVAFKTSYSSTYGAMDNSFASENVSFSSRSFSDGNFNYRIRLRRQLVTASNDASINFKALRIRYRVETTKKSADPNAFNNPNCDYSNNCILDDYIEVIPNVALRCP